MVTLYLYDPRVSSVYPVNTPTTFTRDEAFYHAARAPKRGRAYELWEDGRCIARGGPATEVTCAVRIRKR